MKDDPWETKNLAGGSEHESIVADHRKLLVDYEAPFELAPIRPPATRRRAPGKRAAKQR